VIITAYQGKSIIFSSFSRHAEAELDLPTNHRYLEETGKSKVYCSYWIFI